MDIYSNRIDVCHVASYRVSTCCSHFPSPPFCTSWSSSTNSFTAVTISKFLNDFEEEEGEEQLGTSVFRLFQLNLIERVYLAPKLNLLQEWPLLGRPPLRGHRAPWRRKHSKQSSLRRYSKSSQCYEDYNVVQRLGLNAHSESMVRVFVSGEYTWHVGSDRWTVFSELHLVRAYDDVNFLG